MAIPVLNLPQTYSPLETAATLQQMQQSERQSKVLEQQSALEQQKFLQEQTQKQALQRLTQEALSNDQALDALMATSPDTAFKVMETKAKQAEFERKRITDAGQAAYAFDVTPAMDKPLVYQRTVKSLQQQGFDVSELPAEYDPAKVDPLVKFAISNARDIEKQIGTRQIMETAQGIVSIDPQSGVAIPVVGATRQGFAPLTPYQKPPETVITNIMGVGEKEEQKELGKIRAERYKGFLESGDIAQKSLDSLETMRQAVANPKAAQGAFAGIRTESKKFTELFGFNPEGLKDEAIIAAVGNKLALQLRNPKGDDGGLTGSTSDRDLKFLIEGVPNKNKTQSQNLALIDIATRDKKRTIGLTNFADQYLQENGTLKGFEKAKKQWLEENPLYPEGREKERIKSMLKGGSVSGKVGNVKYKIRMEN